MYVEYILCIVLSLENRIRFFCTIGHVSRVRRTDATRREGHLLPPNQRTRPCRMKKAIIYICLGCDFVGENTDTQIHK